MDTLMARLWILGVILGLVYGLYSGGGVTAIAVMPLMGATFGLVLAMFINELRGRFRKKR